MIEYSLYTMGYHVGDLIQHCIENRQNTDFFEMLVHHLTTSSLYFGYIYGNVIKFGAVVAYLHDIADVPASLGKLFSSTIYPMASLVVGLVMMSLWALTRIYMLPCFIYNIFIFPGFTQAEEKQFNPFL